MLHRGIGLASAAYRYNLSSKNQTSFRRETRLMALSQRLEFRQTQALVMTPQLMQAIKLLQFSSIDLQAYVENELEKNPLLERGSAEDGPAEAADQAGSGGNDSGDFGDSAGEGGYEGGRESGQEGAQDWIGADLE